MLGVPIAHTGAPLLHPLALFGRDFPRLVFQDVLREYTRGPVGVCMYLCVARARGAHAYSQQSYISAEEDER
jgi:hypothetical protein